MSDLAQVLSWPQGEAELVAELQGGSESAFDWLVTHYHGPVFSLVVGMIADPADAADITQEVFLKAYRGIGKFRGGSSLKTWLYRIAMREASNSRRWWWRHHRQQASLDGKDERGLLLQIEDPGESPLDRLAAGEVQQIVRRALRQVPAVFRGAVILRDLEGLGYEEVAEVLDVSVGTVKSRILRGRQALRLILAPLFERTVRTDHAAKHRDSESRSFGGSVLGLGHQTTGSFAFDGGGEQGSCDVASASWQRSANLGSPERGVR
ncbi:MAG TPA: sigma-70 family RNA polymerase sigma factor [Methylomirabilota bacterium]|nr:sigma-70 family RNA polymerase sigma factor [Methylomirabilota bacterium]